MEFGPITQRDLEPCTDLFVRAFAEEPWNEEWPRSQAKRRLAQIYASPGSIGVKAESNGTIVAFAMGRCEAHVSGPHFYLAEMCVEPAYQGQGVGTRILEHLTSVLADMSIFQIYLIPRSNTPAVDFFEKQGFHTARRAIVMTRKEPNASM